MLSSVGWFTGNKPPFLGLFGTMNDMEESQTANASLFELFNDEYVDIKSDLNQIKGLLHDAIDKLTDNFGSLGQDARGQRDLIKKLVEESVESKSINEINRLSDNLNAHVGKAITYLQFEDLTTQLIGKIFKRVDKMKHILIGIESKKTLEEMPELNIPVEAKKIAASVGQENMDSGSIDLF